MRSTNPFCPFVPGRLVTAALLAKCFYSVSLLGEAGVGPEFGDKKGLLRDAVREENLDPVDARVPELRRSDVVSHRKTGNEMKVVCEPIEDCLVPKPLGDLFVDVFRSCRFGIFEQL